MNALVVAPLLIPLATLVATLFARPWPRAVAALSLARTEAVKRGIDAEVIAPSGNWSSGWEVRVDSARDGNFAAADSLLRSYVARSWWRTSRRSSTARPAWRSGCRMPRPATPD